jgi:alpha-2-macroglobulin
MPTDAPVSLSLSASLRGAEGPAPMGHARTIELRTYAPLELVDVRCPRVNLGRCQAHRDISLGFSNEVKPEQLRAHLRTNIPRVAAKAQVKSRTPHAAAKMVDARDVATSRTHLLDVDPLAGKRYRLTLTAGLEDVFGQRLAKDVSVDVDIEAPFSVAPASTSAASSASPDPSADGSSPSRPVLDYEAKIGVRGDLLEARAGRGAKSRLLPVGVVNLPSYAVATQALQEQEALKWLTKADPSLRPGGSAWHWTWTSPGVPQNIRSVQWLDIDALLASSSGSRAAVVALAVPGSDSMPTSSEFLDVTDLAISAKVSRYGTLVWVTHLSTGEVVPGARVSLRTAERDVFSTETDARGLAGIPQAAFAPISKDGSIDGSTWLFVSDAGDWAYQRLERSQADARAAPPGTDLVQKGDWEGLVFTDRGVYKPGDVMKVSALFRRGDAAGLRVPPATDVRVEVKDARNESVFSGYARTNDFGEISLDVPLPHTSHLGSATVEAKLGRSSVDSFSADVTLATYRASEFEVDVQSDAPSYVRGETATFSVKGQYLYGAPMAGASVDHAVSRSRTSFAPKGSVGFTTTDDVFARDIPEETARSTALTVDGGTLDSAGRSTRSLLLDMPGQTGPELVVFEAEVKDLTEQTVAQRASVIVHPAPFYVGLGVPEPRFLAVGAPLEPAVVAFNPDGSHRPGVPVQVDLVSRSWTEVAVDEASDSPRRVTKAVDTVLASCDATTTSGVATCKIRVPSAGYFILRATSASPVVHASTFLYGVDDRPDAPPAVGWSDDGKRGLELESDKETYAAGDTAKVLIRSPFKEADALVTVERAGVLWQDVVHVRGPMPVVSVPIFSAYYPNAFIGVHLVRGRVAPQPALGQADLGAPEFRTAYKEVAIDQDTHRLRVAVSASKSEYHPGDQVDVDVDVTDRDGHPAPSSVTFYAVDEGVLMLTGYETPDPLPAFAGHKSLADFGIESRERLAQILPMKNGERVPILGFEYQSTRDSAPEADKGSAGGGGDDAPLRADFRATADFEPSRATDREGRAHFGFKLPDTLTRFRLMAVVAGGDDRFGRGEASITSSRKLMARPAVPRVVRVGDTFQAGVVVSSNGLPATDVTVTLDAKGLDLDGPRSRRASLPRDGQVEVQFPVRAVRSGSGELGFSVSGGGFADRVLATSRVDLPVDERTAAVYGEMTADTAIALGDWSRVVPDRGSLEVRLATSALVGIEPAFEQLFDYPYGCTEQLTSRTLPLLALDDMAAAMHIRVPAHSHEAVDEAVGAILSHQQDSGGFGYWTDDGALPWLSAYAMWALETASKKGYFVPPSALDRGVEYLRDKLAKADGSTESPDDTAAPEPDGTATAPDETALDDASGAFIADVLSGLGAPDPGYLDRAYEARAGQSLSAQALLLHAMATSHMQPTALQTLAREIEQRLRVGPAEAVADDEGDPRVLDSSARTTALVLRALLAVDAKSPLSPRLARGLLGLRRDGAWRSTQENLWALVALEDYRKTQETQPADIDVETFLGGSSLGTSRLHGALDAQEPIEIPMARLVQSPGADVAFAVKGKGKVFYSAELTYAARDLPRLPEDRGFFVQRLVRALKPNDLAAAQAVLPKTTSSRAELGDLVLVDLLVESSEPRDNVVLADPLPAGIEPIQADLDTSSQIDRVDMVESGHPTGRRALGGYGSAFAQPEDVHREIRLDRVLTFARHLSPGMYHFRYLARATSVGRFVVPPAEIHCMYAPEVSGRTGATAFDVVNPGQAGAGR